MKTVTIQIGNSDNKLSQSDWSAFIDRTRRDIKAFSPMIHFEGFSLPTAAWQNACWIFESGAFMERLKEALEKTRKDFRQDSIAWTEGETKFV